MTIAQLTREEAIAALRFQMEAGADEAVESIPFALRPVEAVEAKPPREDSVSAPTPAPPTPAPPPVPPRNPRWLDDIKSLAGLEKALGDAGGDFVCDLRKTATNMVFADGDAAARLMIIGEAPGADEDRQGRPFVGASGQLLDKMLASIGIARERGEVYITNILNWRPPGNRTPSPEEAALFLPVIRKHIELAAPQVIFAVGGAAAKTLLGRSEGILKLRGRWHEVEIGGRMIPLLPSLHPSYLLRSPGQKQLAWQDLRMLKNHLDGKSDSDSAG